MADAGKDLVDLTNLVLFPQIRREINAFGHSFKRGPGIKTVKGVKRGLRMIVADVDMFLHSNTEAMAGRVKISVYDEDVRDHIDQLECLRKYEKEAHIQNKRLYGAVVGVYVCPDARNLALKNGLYVLEIMEDESSLKTDKPPKCRVW